MKLTKKTIAVSAGALLFSAALTGATACLMASTALDREGPKIMKKVGGLISRSPVDGETVKLIRAASARLSEAETEHISIRSRDNIELAGHWYPCENPKRIVIAMHGWRSSWTADFGMSAPFMHDNGCSILFAEQRGQNGSGGECMGFGVTERYDCLDWLSYVVSCLSDTLPIYLCGISMGATTVLMASGLELPENVHGVIADCGFTSPDEIWQHIARNNLHLAYSLCRPIAAGIYQRKNQACAFDCSTEKALCDTQVPVLFIHGTDDHFVPVEMTYRNYMACAGPKRLLIVPGAEHGMSYLTDKSGYENAVMNFWREFD
ncbi:MAG: alpha/beta hydrolase [Candidatus Heteroscillospira sp.]|jgi:fermentation-respiration switch protein FrsA (DUF1100 family)